MVLRETILVRCAATGEAGRKQGRDRLAADSTAELALYGLAALATSNCPTTKVRQERF
jgi:hypothetical protein